MALCEHDPNSIASRSKRRRMRLRRTAILQSKQNTDELISILTNALRGASNDGSFDCPVDTWTADANLNSTMVHSQFNFNPDAAVFTPLVDSVLAALSPVASLAIPELPPCPPRRESLLHETCHAEILCTPDSCFGSVGCSFSSQDGVKQTAVGDAVGAPGRSQRAGSRQHGVGTCDTSEKDDAGDATAAAPERLQDAGCRQQGLANCDRTANVDAGDANAAVLGGKAVKHRVLGACSGSSATSVHDSRNKFEPGMCVALSSLKRRADLNGSFGILLHPAASPGRWAVRVHAHYTQPQAHAHHEDVSCAEDNLSVVHTMPGSVVRVEGVQGFGVALCATTPGSWMVLHLSLGSVDRVPSGSLHLVAPFYEDTAFPPDIGDVELQELTDAMTASREQFLNLAQEAFRACGSPIGPAVPQGSLELLENLIEAISDRAARSELRHLLRRCAADDNVWTALRLADHRMDMMHREP